MRRETCQSSNGLPREGQQIEFLLDHRSVAMAGTYTHQVFHTLWAEYDIDRVRSWRNLFPECDRATPIRSPAACIIPGVRRHDTSHYPLPAGGMTHAT